MFRHNTLYTNSPFFFNSLLPLLLSFLIQFLPILKYFSVFLMIFRNIAAKGAKILKSIFRSSFPNFTETFPMLRYHAKNPTLSPKKI